MNAIRSKDPRVYDKRSTFYSPLDAFPNGESKDENKKKPMYLRDYHRKNLLGDLPAESTERIIGLTPAQEEAKLKADVIRQMHDADKDDSGDDGNEDFLVAKPTVQSQQTSEANRDSIPDPAVADADPDGFLDSLMNSRAWVPDENTQPHPFESDDESEEARADEFEEAFNMRFEDPARANEKLLSHSRQAAAKQSVRKDAPKARKRAREVEKARKDAEKALRDEEWRRLKKLRFEEAQEKLRLFKEAAGEMGKEFDEEEWVAFLEKGFEGERWDEEMRKRFGDEYYAAKGPGGSNENLEDDKYLKSSRKRKAKVKKPKWDADIDIGDIIPDFSSSQHHFTLSDSEQDANGHTTHDPEIEPALRLNSDQEPPIPPARTKAALKKAKKTATRDRQRAELQSVAERSKIDSLVDRSLATDTVSGLKTLSSLPSSKSDGLFPYRETSPTAFGLSAREILMADDSQLNQYAGLKKLAAFRDQEKKEQDRKRFKASGKKGRLKEWRKQVFGDREGPRKEWGEFMREKVGVGENIVEERGIGNFDGDGKADVGRDERKKKSKKKSNRSMKRKVQDTSE